MATAPWSFAIYLVSESGGIYASREEFEADEYGKHAKNHVLV